MSRPSPVVTLHVWGVPRRQVPAALLAMGRDRSRLRAQPGLGFGKLLGTGSGQTFTPGDADPRHWGILGCWSDRSSADAFDRSDLAHRWDDRSEERLRLELQPLASRGCWAGVEPFGRPQPAGGPAADPVAVLTRARIRPRMWRTFWRSVPAVSASLDGVPGLLFRIGIGEAPVGLQGTFSVWSGSAALQDFAYRRPEHREAVERTHRLRWYSEELFARFAVRSAEGTYGGTAVTLGPT